MLPAKIMVGRLLQQSSRTIITPSLSRYSGRFYSTSLLRSSSTSSTRNSFALPLSHITKRSYAKTNRPDDQSPTSDSPSYSSIDQIPKSNESTEPIRPENVESSETEPAMPKFDPRTLLDQGIPPTPDQYSTTVATKPDPTSSERSRDPIKSSQSRGSGGGNPEYVSSTDRKRERLATYLFTLFMLSGVGGVVYLGRNWETQEEIDAHPDEPNGWGAMPFYNRIMSRLNEVLDYYNLPNGDKLLPDMTKDTYRPYTLVISLEDMLVHSEWTREHGWRTAKRPGVEYFLTYLGQYYEIVIFTSQPNVMAAPIVAKLDPFRTCHQLYREATKYKRGKYIKDLTYLNRDLSKVIMIDTKPEAWAEQPENAIKMKKWMGNPRDKELVSLIPFLEFIAAMGHVDLREDIKSFPEGSHIPTEFAKRDAIARAELQKKIEEQKKHRKSSGGGDFLASLLGMKPKEVKEEKLPQDLVRERGQQWYDEITRGLKEHGAEILEADRKAQEEMMAGMKTSLSKILTEGMPQPQLPPLPEQEQPQQKK
ncbi:mitochondrial inner membrane protein required for protein import [Orbilia oligospora]|uniref:Mitochondrial import inner membrane translocase subunit TIM50 n=2 Tax=Orbilia oligospora TaxID=2813651 RepID=A0A7C8QI50_ORBOL|nr:mitochondrial inner membrane protein required for protein import [Orbilia oligospora]